MTDSSKQDTLSELPVNSPMLSPAITLLRAYWWRMLAISAVVITPCLWHASLGSGDLCSHVYNAWLAQLINNGQVHGLWLASQWDNVFFDFMLSGLGNVFDWNVAEKVAASTAVLIFFWGAFSLIWAMTRIVPWFSVPCLAMFSYGWTFEMGFMNYYLAIGMAFFGLAILVSASGWSRLWAIFLVPPIWLAHPLGLIFLVAAGSYAFLAQRLSIRHRGYLFAVCAILLVTVSTLVNRRYSNGAVWTNSSGIVHDGIDQLLLYGPEYRLPARLFLVFSLICLTVDITLVRREPRWWSPYLLPMEFYLFALLTAVLFPSFIDIWKLHKIGFKSIGFLTERLTSVTAVFFCCLLGAIKPQKWHIPGFCTIGIIYFLLLFRDTATLSVMEAEVRSCLMTISPGQRVIGTIHNFKGSRVSVHGILDAACIGRCFDYDNYEAASQQFRVRALPGNSIVLTNFADCQAAATGKYIVRAADLPLYQIEQCASNTTKMSIRALVAGKTNGCLPF